MAETKPTAAKAATSVQPKKNSNIVSWIAPIVCIIIGYLIWRFILGNASGFKEPDTSGAWFWPGHKKPITALNRIYEGGIVVPFLIGLFLMVFAFSIERYLTIRKALGAGSASDFVRNVQFHLANKNIEAAMAACDKQKGSVANVMKAGLRKYKAMTEETGLDTDQKVLAIQKEVEEATALELPMLQQNMVFLSTLTSLGTLIALLGTVMGMIGSFSAMNTSGAPDAAALAGGISEALLNTATGIGTSFLAIIFYNLYTTIIDGIIFGIDESGFTLSQSFSAQYK